MLRCMSYVPTIRFFYCCGKALWGGPCGAAWMDYSVARDNRPFQCMDSVPLRRTAEDRRELVKIFRFEFFALPSNWGQWHQRRSGRLSFQRPCSIPFGPIPQLAATDLLIAGAAEPPAVVAHPG